MWSVTKDVVSHRGRSISNVEWVVRGGVGSHGGWQSVTGNVQYEEDSQSRRRRQSGA